MSLLLHIETATAVCSAALAENGKLLSLKEVNEGYSHGENITLFIEQVLKEAQRKISDLDAVAISSGPGSYTGLRIGVSTAKGICYALDKPLVAVPTLLVLTETFRHSKREAGSMMLEVPASGLQPPSSIFCPMIDARRMEVFCAFYDEELKELEKTAAEIIDENSFSEILQTKNIFFFGDGAAKCKAVLAHQPNAVFIDDIYPTAASMITMAEAKFRKKEFEDVALFEPFYLKEFQDGKSKG